jgi:hypothetical protein
MFVKPTRTATLADIPDCCSWISLDVGLGQTQPPGAVQAEISHIEPPILIKVAGGIGMTRLLRLPNYYLEQNVRRRSSIQAWLWLRRIAATTPPMKAARMMTAAAMNMNMVHLSRKKVGRIAL